MGLRVWRHFDFVLMLTVVGLLVTGMAFIYSATWGGEPGLPKDDAVYKQALYGVMGLVLAAVAVALDYRLLNSGATLFYVVCLGLLGVVLLGGQSNYGAQRWIDLRIIPLQPSEPAKIAVVLMLARYLARHEEEIGRFRYVVGSLVIVAIPASLVLMQPHLGTTVVMGTIWLAMMLAGGIRVLHLFALGGMALAASPAVWLALPEYQRGRVLQFFGQGEANPLGADYNIRQALISVGSGGLTGRGYLSGSQSQLHFLRVRHTDFIFSVLAEELGFVGACALLLLFLLLLWRMLRVAVLSRDPFGRYVAVGLASYIMIQAFINVGMNVRLLPVVGMPLPFVSYGGSSLITAILCVGILESIVMRHKRLEF
ncbi:MAG: rod shape-determining protein RodA [Chloroflexota bacterium]